MADKKSNFDLYMQQYLAGMRENRLERELNPNALTAGSLQSEQIGSLIKASELANQRDLADMAQDTGAGLIGTLGAIGSTIDLGINAAADAGSNIIDRSLGRTDTNSWDGVSGALTRMNKFQDVANSLQTAKSDAFDRVTGYRTEQAIKQANADAQENYGRDANWAERTAAAAISAGSDYIDNPGQVITDSIAQIPYALTGSFAAGLIAKSTKIASPLISGLTKTGMSVEGATKLVNLGIADTAIGLTQGTMEGADAAANTYSRVKNSKDTFGPDEEAARESAALDAAGKAFLLAGATSAISGAVLSKFELDLFGTQGSSVLSRTGNNLVKAGEEALQESIESGTSQFAVNLAGNDVLKGRDRVALDEGVGAAIGQGAVVGAGSTMITNPRALVDAVVAPAILAGRVAKAAYAPIGSYVVKKEQAENMAAATTTANQIVANIATPATTNSQTGQQTPNTTAATSVATEVLTPEEEKPWHEGIDTQSMVHTLASGIERLKSMPMTGANIYQGFFVLGDVLRAAHVTRDLLGQYQKEAADMSLPEDQRAKATEQVDLIKSLLHEDTLNKLIEDIPWDSIEENIDTLKEHPEEFAGTVARLAALNPLNASSTVLNIVQESKSLTPTQRESVDLAIELKQAQEELKVGPNPNSSEVSRSIMHTGFPGSDKKLSIADMLRNVTAALEQNDPDAAQIHFKTLATFSNYLSERAKRFLQTKKELGTSTEKSLDVPDTRTFDNTTGELTDTPFRLHGNSPKSVAVVNAVVKDAEVVAKMVEAMQKRTGLKVVIAKRSGKNQNKKNKQAAAKAPATTTTAAAPVTITQSDKALKKEQDKLVAMSDAQLDKELGHLKGQLTKVRAKDKSKHQVAHEERRFDVLSKEKNRREAAKKTETTSSGTTTEEDVIETATENSAPKDFTDHSGGAEGADSMFDTIGKALGFIKHNHYYHGRKTPLGNVKLTDTQVAEGIVHAKAAAKVLGRPWNAGFSSLLGRNWFQVKNATQVVAIGRLIKPGEINSKGYPSKAARTTVDGGTGYAVEMAIANGKKVHVFDIKRNQWYVWKDGNFVTSQVPVLDLNYAGIGSRQDKGNMTPESVQAIRDVYEKTLKSLKQEDQTTEKPAAKKAEPAPIITPVDNAPPLTGEDKKRGFALNKGQKSALIKVTSFLKDKTKKTFSLIGAAGTGKTTIVEEILNGIGKQFDSVVLSAPTHRANAVTRSKNSDGDILTLHKLLGLKPKTDIEKFDAKNLQFEGSTGDIKPNTLIILDESSMINDKLFDYLMERVNASPGTKVIFLGDLAQLNPVKQPNQSKSLDSTDDQAELTEVMRAKNPELLDESVAVRESGTFTYTNSMDDKGNGVAFSNMATSFINKAVKFFKSDDFVKNRLLVRVLAHSNEKVREYNRKIREVLFPDQVNIVTGDLLMGYNAFGQPHPETGMTQIANGIDYMVTKVTQAEDTNVLRVYDDAGTLHEAIVPVQFITIQDVFNLSGPRIIQVVANTATAEQKNQLRAIFTILMAQGAWKDTGKARKIMDGFTEQYALPFDITYRKEGQTYDWTAVKQSFDFGYAHTIHKSQGGTYEYAMVDDINLSGSPASADEKSRLRYTALTRAKHGTYVLTNKKISGKVETGAKPKAKQEQAAPAAVEELTTDSEMVFDNNIVFDEDRSVVPVPDVTAKDDSGFDSETAAEPEVEEQVEEVKPPPVVESVPSTEKSKNWFSNLMASYKNKWVTEKSSVADQNKEKNHLTQSFTKSDKPGLLSKLPEVLQDLVDSIGLRHKEDIEIAGKVLKLKNTIRDRLQYKIASILPPDKVKVLKTKSYWSRNNNHSLYAAIWNDKGEIAYDPVIADVMAWTAVQHMLDLAFPMNWSQDKKAAMMDTYGHGILDMMEDGWVPMAEQVQQLAKKLQINLELRADSSVSTKYTDGTMLALALDAMSTMFPEQGWDGPMLVQEMTTEQGAPVHWIKVGTQNRDLLIDTGKVLEGFFPERASTNAGIVGKPPTKVNPFYRNSQQKISKKQHAANTRRANTPLKLSPLLLKMSQAFPDGALERLLGWKAVPKERVTYAQIERNGANNTLEADLRVIKNHVDKVKAYAEEHGMSITEVESFFEHENVVNGRSMTKGVSPQSSKWYREMFSTVQRVIDPKKVTNKWKFAVAQGFGSKMDKRKLSESLAWFEEQLTKPEVKRAIEAAHRFGQGDVSQLEEDLTAFEQSGIEMTPHAVSALIHWAAYEAALKAGTTFTSSLSYEIDGLTDGPINLMMLMGLRGGAKAMESWLKLGGLFFGPEKISVQDRIQEIKDAFGAPDLYGIIALKARELNIFREKQLMDSVLEDSKEEAQALLKGIDQLMIFTGLAEYDKDGNLINTRAFTKKPTQASGYLQGEGSIVNDLANSILSELSKKLDSKTLTTEERQKIHKVIDTVFGTRIGWDDKGKYHYITDQEGDYSAVGWRGQPLTRLQFQAFSNTLHEYGGYGLAKGTLEVIGPQRAKLMAANALMAAHIKYAQKILEQKYKEKQAKEVALGNLEEGDSLSRDDETALLKEVWETLIPHPILRNTEGLPVASSSRISMAKDYVKPVHSLLFGHYSFGVKNVNLLLSEAAFSDPGVSFGALSIMAAGDGSMMTGFFSNNDIDALDMYDGIYIDPEFMDDVADKINKEVKENWDHNFIKAILDSLKMTPDFEKWANSQPATNRQAAKEGVTLWQELGENKAILVAQEIVQNNVKADIESRDRSYSHMAGTDGAHWVEGTGTPLDSTTIGTSVIDPLLDLAADSLGHEANHIRKLSAADVKALLKDHTFENPVLGGLWKVLSPLISDNLTLFVSQDKQAIADFYQQNERLEMGQNVNGVSIGDRVYIRTLNAETLSHELLHATTRNITAAYFSNPNLLTASQREAMKNLLTLMDDFMALDGEAMSPMQGAMVQHVQVIMQGYLSNGDQNSALQEFLAYGLNNYHLQRTLGTTKSTLGKLVESVFNAIKALFKFPNGTQSDSMLAAMLSNFEVLATQAVNVAYPVSFETALNAIDPGLGRTFGNVLERLLIAKQLKTTILEAKGQLSNAQIAQANQKYVQDHLTKLRDMGRTRMQELDTSNLFPKMTNEQLSAGEYIQAVFAAGLQFNAKDNAILSRVVDTVRDKGLKLWRDNEDPLDTVDIAKAQARFDFFFNNIASEHDRSADILAMALVNPKFAEYLHKEVLPRHSIDKGSFNNLLDSIASTLYDISDTGFALNKNSSLADALEVATLRIHQSLLASAKREEAKPNVYRRLTNQVSEGIQLLGEKAGKAADVRLGLKSGKDWIGSGLMLLAGLTNDSYAGYVADITLKYSNHLKSAPGRELINELVGTASSNYKLIQLKGVASRMISSIRQAFREQVPVQVKSWFKDLNPEMDELLHRVIGKFSLYSLSSDLRDQIEDLFTKDGVDHAITIAKSTLLGGGDHVNKKRMIDHALRLGDRMAGVSNLTTYLNTQAIAGLVVEGGAKSLTANQMAALENLSTLQALTHLTPTQRRAMLALYRENKDGFWKTTALANAFFNLDTQRAGKYAASMNFQKGYIPSETDNRKKVKLVHKSEVLDAQRLGWVVVPGISTFKGEGSMVYMATTVGKTPTLSGGAIHAIDKHMNGIHFHTGLPTDPGIQTTITDFNSVASIKKRILSGEVVPYSALFDSDGNVVGFQRLLDIGIMDLHTKTVGRVSEALGIWLGRIHEEQVAQHQNQAAVNLLAETWKKAIVDGDEDEFVNISDPSSKSDKVLLNVWKTLPYHTKIQLEIAFAKGDTNPPIMIRRDQLNDAIGYHKASVGNFFTGNNRYSENTNATIAPLARQMLGKGAYKYLTVGEEVWQSTISAAKNTIIVKSLTIALNNLASNQIQLFMITGNPIWNLRVQAQKHKELVSYLGYQSRIARLVAEGFTTNDPKDKERFRAEQHQLKLSIRKLSIWPLIEAGELPNIAEGLSETEEFTMAGDATAWLETQVGKMPPVVGTIINNLAISKNTSIYKGMDRLVQYGDFVAKASMHEWLTTQDKGIQKKAYDLYASDKNPDKTKRITLLEALNETALREVNDEFINYSRLPGRWRTYGEDMGLTWFYNYKLRIMKMSLRRARKNPIAFLIGIQTGGLLGIPTLLDTVPGIANFAYSTGLDPLWSAHNTHLWVNMVD